MIGYISIKQILDNILTHPLLLDLPLERAVNYSQEFIRIVGCPKLFTEKLETLLIKDYRALLPCDCLEVIQVRKKDGDTFRYTTDTFFDTHKGEDAYLGKDLSYKILGNIIYTTIKEGDIEIIYLGIALDEDGFPLIPDNASFIKALELYIKKLWFTILFDLGKINGNAYLNVVLEYSWYVGLALNDLIKPSLDEMESIANMWNTLIQRVSEHKNGFKTLGTKEFIKVQ